MLIPFAFCLSLVAGSNGLSLSTKIVNGTNAAPGEIPYIVSVRKYGSHNCGGSILNETHILTAAHCIDGTNAKFLTIQYGITDLKDKKNIIQVAKAVHHEDYSPWNHYINDIAVLTLKEQIVFSDTVKPVILPAQGEATPAGATAVLAGWGYDRSGGSVQRELQRVDLIIYSDKNCTASHGSSVNTTYQLCAGVPEEGKGQCSGDSGGPLYANGKQVGVVSWSVKPCALKGYPGVFARVAAYIDWIKNQMKK